MALHIHSITGNIVAEAPERCQLTALWLRDGSPLRVTTWKAIREEYQTMRCIFPPRSRTRNTEKPWLNPNGATFELARADNQLRYIHILPNPLGKLGCPDLPAVGAAVAGALDEALRLVVQKVGFIHIPVSPGSRRPTQTQDERSAIAMIGAIGAWDAAHPEAITDVFLFDHDGQFRRFVIRANATHARRSQTLLCLSSALPACTPCLNSEQILEAT